MNGVGKKMSEQAPGYFSFHFTQWQYIKNREKRRKGNIEIWGKEGMYVKNSIKSGSILNSSAQKQLRYFHGIFSSVFNPFCRTLLLEEGGWNQKITSRSYATQGLTPENLLAVRHSPDITEAALWQKLFLWEKVLYLKMRRIQKQNGKQNPMNGSIHEAGKFFNHFSTIFELSLVPFLLGEVLEEDFIPHTQLIPHSTYQWHYPHTVIPLSGHSHTW